MGHYVVSCVVIEVSFQQYTPHYNALWGEGGNQNGRFHHRSFNANKTLSNADEILRHLRWSRNETSVSIKSRIFVKGFDFPLKAKLKLIFLTLSVIMVTGKLWVVIITVIPNNSMIGFSKLSPISFSSWVGSWSFGLGAGQILLQLSFYDLALQNMVDEI